MLEQLSIRDLALLRESRVEPSARLTVISGATGGGKTLVVQALRLLRGERARADMVRRGAKAAAIDGVFRLDRGERSDGVRSLYAEILGTPPEEDRLVVSRVVDQRGRSQARVDGRPVALRDLARFGAYLIEIHGQGSNRSLVRPETQTELLDAFAGLTTDRQRFARMASSLRELAGRVADLHSSERERRERIEFLRYCLEEIGRVDPEPGELVRLSTEAALLANLERLQRSLGQGLQLLHEGGDDQKPILESVSWLAGELESLAKLDGQLTDAARVLEEATVLLDDAVGELRRGIERLDLDPGRAAEVDARLSELHKLGERFGPSEEEIFVTRARMTMELAQAEELAERPGALERELSSGLEALDALGAAISRKRRRAARRLSRAMVAELELLGMARTEVEIRVEDHPGDDVLARATELGTSVVEVVLAPNPGEPAAPLRETASGGEVARVMLVLKKILADTDRVPVLVFDEIDAEIGGRLGLAVGRKLREVAAEHQVLCVTHLPQIAAFADTHWLVEKEVEQGEDGERTVARVRNVTGPARRHELASMARGEGAIDDAALEEANRLLGLAGGASC